MHPVLDSLFFPRKIYQEPLDTDLFIYTDGFKLSCRLHIFSKKYDTILLFHGNGEIVSDYDYISGMYKGIRKNLIVFDYRGYGHSEGKPTAESLFHDSESVFKYIESYLQDNSFSGRLFVLGRSLGSVPALEIADTFPDQFSGIIIESGFCSESPVLEMLGIDTQSIEFLDSMGFNNLSKISCYTGPILIIHAENDEIVPFNQAKLMMDKSPSKNKKLLTVPGAGHNNIYQFGAVEYFKAIKEFTEALI
tara:strand:- start:124 stop:870 length:747 start_codon:yes stop_codon:yes gene_type:complete